MSIGLRTIGCLIVGCIVLQDRTNASDSHRGDYNYHRQSHPHHHQPQKNNQHYAHQRDNQTLKMNQQRERLKAKHEERKQKEINKNFAVLTIENKLIPVLVGVVLMNVARANASIQHPFPPSYDFKGHTHFERNISKLFPCQSQVLGAEVPHFIQGQGQGN